MNLADVTLDQLKTATKVQILAFISNKLSAFTKLQLCRLILRVSNVDVDSLLEIPDPVIRTGDSRGPLTWREVVRDISGNKTRTRKADYAYYPTGEVHKITLTELGGADVEVSRKVIEHFTDGRQPIEV